MTVPSLTIVGAGREGPVGKRRGRLGAVCARGAHEAASCGPAHSLRHSVLRRQSRQYPAANTPVGGRTLSATVRGRNDATRFAYARKRQGRRAKAKILRLRLRERARSVCKVVGDFLGFSCVCRRCGCG